MRGAERSLVTVGRSFTVAKGFVPLTGGGGRGGSEKGQVPNWLGIQGRLLGI